MMSKNWLTLKESLRIWHNTLQNGVLITPESIEAFISVDEMKIASGIVCSQ